MIIYYICGFMLVGGFASYGVIKFIENITIENEKKVEK